MTSYRIKTWTILPHYANVRWPDFSELNYPRTGEWVTGQFPTGDEVVLEVKKIVHKEELGMGFGNSTHVVEIELR